MIGDEWKLNVYANGWLAYSYQIAGVRNGCCDNSLYSMAQSECTDMVTSFYCNSTETVRNSSLS